jgi:putative DNA methylase
VTYKKKLIEVALPLEAINKASAREKSIRHGHPSTLHLWWARRPLAAARAVIFAQMVDDPSAHPDLFPTEKAQEEERQRLFRIIEDLVLWENTTNETVLQQARDEIWQSWRYTCAENADHPRAKELFDRYKLPAFHDPFAGGGSLPLEAQRLGLEAYASDLNPVAVLINKAMIEIPPRFAGRPPVHPEVAEDGKSGKTLGKLFEREWKGAEGLAEDVRYYGQWMRDEAERRIGHLYPKIEVTAAMARDPENPRPDLEPYVGRKLTVIAWLWARTVKSPNPAFATVDVPLASTFMLSTKAGKEAWVEPVIQAGGYRFTVYCRSGFSPTGRPEGRPTEAELMAAAKNGTKLARGANFRCLMSGSPISGDYIKAEGKAGRMSACLMAIVAEGQRGRVYLAPTAEMEAMALTAQPSWRPEGDIPTRMTGGNCTPYGLTTWCDLFTPRQLVALTTFSDLVQEARERMRCDAIPAGLPDDGKALEQGGAGATAYADAVGVYLAFAISKLSDRGSTICTWFTERDSTRNTFARQSIPMTWDYAELNTLLDGTGSFLGAVEWTAESIQGVAAGFGSSFGASNQFDATSQSVSISKLVSTDPPYYDNIGYADLSDFFYVWLRRSLKPVFPNLFATLAVPKAEELVATPYRHGSKEKAETFFLDGMTQAMRRLAEQAHPAFPVTIYYAFKQAETKGDAGTTNTGWDTFLAAVIEAGFAITGTWPMRTELGNRMIGSGTNALASSIVLVCRKRPADAPTATRREFITALKTELPTALAHLQRGNIAPVDLAQAAIGPGMAVYTRYAQVLDAEGKPLPVRAALALINQTLDEALAEQEGDFDADTRWALTWFEQMAFNEGEYGVAEQLATSKNTSVSGLADAGILRSKAGKVRLLKPAEFPAGWDPTTDKRLTVWEMVHQLIRALESGGETAAAALLAKLGSESETARELCYRLYTLCERKKRANEAMAYNGLVQSWPEIARLARETGSTAPQGTGDLFAQP